MISLSDALLGEGLCTDLAPHSAVSDPFPVPPDSCGFRMEGWMSSPRPQQPNHSPALAPAVLAAPRSHSGVCAQEETVTLRSDSWSYLSLEPGAECFSLLPHSAAHTPACECPPPPRPPARSAASPHGLHLKVVRGQQWFM